MYLNLRLRFGPEFGVSFWLELEGRRTGMFGGKLDVEPGLALAPGPGRVLAPSVAVE